MKNNYSGRNYKGNLISKRKNGELFYEDRTITPILAASGEITHYVSISRDITKRVEAEEALAESENRYLTITETATDAIITADEDGLITLANPAAERLFGFPSQALIGQPITILMPGKYKQRIRKWLAQSVESKEQIVDWGNRELTGRHRDGRDIPVEISFGQFIGDGGISFVAIIRDIRKRKQAQEALRASEENFRSIFRSAPESLLTVDAAINVLNSNNIFSELIQLYAHQLNSSEEALRSLI